MWSSSAILAAVRAWRHVGSVTHAVSAADEVYFFAHARAIEYGGHQWCGLLVVSDLLGTTLSTCMSSVLQSYANTAARHVGSARTTRTYEVTNRQLASAAVVNEHVVWLEVLRR